MSCDRSSCDGCSGCGSTQKGCAGGGCGRCCGRRPVLAERHTALLRELAALCFLPIVRLADDAAFPLLLFDPTETIETVRQRGEALDELSRAGLLSIDDDLPLSGCDYAEYLQSPLCASGAFSRGSIALTGRGQALIEDLFL